MGNDKRDRHITIIGRVVLHEGIGVDSDCIEIMTDEDVYAVELDYVGKQLLEFADQIIKVTGQYNKYSDGSLQIIIDDYEVIDEIDEDEAFDVDDYVQDVETELDYPDDYLLEEDYY